MKPQKKARYLYEKMKVSDNIYFHDAKECALIAVSEIINVVCGDTSICNSTRGKYWKEVKHELENLNAS